jgi:hypothetical protein
VFILTLAIDGQALESITLAIGPLVPNAPSNGDLWLDTSGADTSLGNGTAGTFTPANPADYVLKRWVSTWNKWVHVPGGGQQSTRATIPIAFAGGRGTRFTTRLRCTLATGRFQIENFSDKPAIVSEAM